MSTAHRELLHNKPLDGWRGDIGDRNGDISDEAHRFRRPVGKLMWDSMTRRRSNARGLPPHGPSGSSDFVGGGPSPASVGLLSRAAGLVGRFLESWPTLANPE